MHFTLNYVYTANTTHVHAHHHDLWQANTDGKVKAKTGHEWSQILSLSLLSSAAMKLRHKAVKNTGVCVRVCVCWGDKGWIFNPLPFCKDQRVSPKLKITPT